MLPTELLLFEVKGGVVTPKRFKPTTTNLKLAEAVIAVFTANLGKRRSELLEDLQVFDTGQRSVKVSRGLAHLLMQQAEFAPGGRVEPALTRQKVFALAQGHPPSRRRAPALLEQAARELGADHLSAQDVLTSLYGDLEGQQVLTHLDPPTPEELLSRFDLAHAQGILYRAYLLILTARPNEPARYKQLLKYAKFFGLMLHVQGDATFGFTLTLDGPTSLFSSTTRYGLAMAKFLPALLHVTKWDLSATIKPRRDLAWVEPGDDEWQFGLTSEDGYVSHYKPPEEHDSALESGFTERFGKLDTPWELQREVDLVPVPGGVILPDFRLVHPDGRSVLVEIVGYWRPEYLRKKFNLLRKSERTDVIVCVSEDPSDFGDRVVWFKGVLNPKEVLAVAERLAAGAASM